MIENSYKIYDMVLCDSLTAVSIPERSIIIKFTPSIEYVEAWWPRGHGVCLVIWKLLVLFPSCTVTLLPLSGRGLIWQLLTMVAQADATAALRAVWDKNS